MTTRPILLTGYAGFDPLGFSDYYDIKWLQEAEIKHGRICMLAAVGMVSWLRAVVAEDWMQSGRTRILQFKREILSSALQLLAPQCSNAVRARKLDYRTRRAIPCCLHVHSCSCCVGAVCALRALERWHN